MAIVQRLCKFCGDWHYTDRWPHNCMPAIPPGRSDLPAPAIISDTLPGGVNGLYHHGALRRIDSKSEYRRETKARGYIEVGNERHHERRHVHVHSADRDIEATVAEAVQEMEQKGLTVDETA